MPFYMELNPTCAFICTHVTTASQAKPHAWPAILMQGVIDPRRLARVNAVPLKRKSNTPQQILKS